MAAFISEVMNDTIVGRHEVRSNRKNYDLFDERNEK